MLVNANAVINYNRCRRFAALNDPFTALYLNKEMSQENAVFRDILLSHLYSPQKEIRKNINLTYEFEHEITLSENYDFLVDDDIIYCLTPYTSTDFVELKFKDGQDKVAVFQPNQSGIFEPVIPKITNKNLEEKLDKLYSTYESLGRIVFSYALKYFILKKVYPQKNYRLYFVFLNSEYMYDGISYSEKLYHLFDFSKLDKIDEIVEIALFRMINHLELNDFTPCILEKKACSKGKPNACKFIDFCYSHLPENTSILDYFNSHLGFNETTEEGNIHHDTYDLLNEGYVSMQDLPIFWLKDQNNLMQRYCCDNSSLFFHAKKLDLGLNQMKYPLYYLDFEANPQAIPKYRGESPYSQSVFQYSIHIQSHPNHEFQIDENHFEFLANPLKDERKLLLENLIRILNQSDSSIVVHNKTFEKTRLEELKLVFPEFQKDINKIINRLFDLLDIIKTNKTLYQRIGYDGADLEVYNLYHPDLGGSYSLKQVIKLFKKDAYENLLINDGVKAYKAFQSLSELTKVEADEKRKNLLLYCRQDTYSMYQIVQGLKALIGKESK